MISLLLDKGAEVSRTMGTTPQPIHRAAGAGEASLEEWMLCKLALPNTFLTARGSYAAASSAQYCIAHLQRLVLSGPSSPHVRRQRGSCHSTAGGWGRS